MTDAKAVTFTDPVGDELTRALKASSSMSIIAKPQRTSQCLCMDGGVADSIPYDIAQQQGFKKIIIVRPRDINYRKKPTSRALTLAPQHPVKVSRIEGNTKKLVELYKTGKQEINQVLPQMIKYLEK